MPIKLSNLVRQAISHPAELAHKLGLNSAGWGYWRDESGKTVAKTVDGNLTKLDPRKEKNKRGNEPTQQGSVSAADRRDIQRIEPSPEEVTSLTTTAGYSLTDIKVMALDAEQDGKRQARELYQELSPEDKQDLLSAKKIWQSDSQYAATAENRDFMSNTFNKIFDKYHPEIHSESPIFRGMLVDIKNTDAMIQQFKPGEAVDLPLSGFSANPKTACHFAKSPYGRKTSVLFRLSSSTGKMGGLRLHGLDQTYLSELEVIRPAGRNQKCTNITYFDNNGNPTYIIDLEDTGGEQLHESESTDTNGLLHDLMHGSMKKSHI